MIDQITNLLFGRKPEGNLLRHTKALAGAIPLIAQALVDRRGKKIRIERSGQMGARTDGTVIQIEDTPIPASAHDTDAFIVFTAVQLGLVHHEIGHVNHTDFTSPRGKDPLARHLENIIEDVRQELLHIRTTHNGRNALNALGLAFMERRPPDWQEQVQQMPAEQVLANWVLSTLRRDVRGESYCDETAQVHRARLVELIGEGPVVAVEAMLPQAANLADTGAAIAMADQVLATLRQHLPPPPPKMSAPGDSDSDPQQSSDGSGKQQGKGSSRKRSKQSKENAQASATDNQGDVQDPANDNDANSGSDGNPADAGDPQEQGSETNANSDGDANGLSGGDNQSTSGAGGAGGADGDPTDGDASSTPSPQYGTPEQSDALEQLLQGNELEGSGDRAEAARELIRQLIEAISDNGGEVLPYDPQLAQAAGGTSPKQHLLDPSVDLDACMGQVGRSSAVLRKKLQAMSVAKTSRKATGAQLHRNALVTASLGDPRLFRKYTAAQDLDTAVVLAIDCSGSMGHQPMHLADQATYATACALETLPGCHVAVIGFPSQIVVLPFGARARKHRHQFALRSHGGTPMEEAVHMARRMLATRNEPRKLLVVVTDGGPNSLPAVEMELLAAEREGIEAMAIGILTDAPRHIFARSAAISNIAQLPQTLMSMLEARMLADREAA